MKKIVCLLLLVLSACQKNEVKSRLAEADILASFAAESLSETPGLEADRVQVKIKKSALEKEFLLSVNAIEQGVVPLFTAGQSRVIFFRRVEGYVVAFEEAPVETTDVKPLRLVARFPILKETDEEISFDFNAGMSALFVGAWYNQEGQVETKYQMLAVDSSFVSSVNFNSHRMIVNQWARVKPSNVPVSEEEGGASSSPISNLTVEVKYYLSPYRKNENFKPTRFKDNRYFGYFTTPFYQGAAEQPFANAVKFDLSKPIVFALSANTPKDLIQSFKDGVLYWNKAFGRELVQVVLLQDASIRAPHPDYNVIQWVENDNAGFAYADMSVDPRSGEVLNAQIFIPSAFHVVSLREGRRLLREHSRASVFKVGLNGFESKVHCARNLVSFTDEVRDLLSNPNASDELLKKISDDYMSTLIAHEVGHTLGLRHNFAGSLHASYSFKDLPGLVKEYMIHGQVPEGLRPTSSVMDYTIFEDDLFTGDSIRKSSEQALDYDGAAIRHLYLGQDYDLSKVPLFCTDEDLEIYNDCNVYDSGFSNLESASLIFRKTLNGLSDKLMQGYLLNRKEGKSINAPPLIIKEVVEKWMGTRKQALKHFNEQTLSRKLAHEFDFVEDFNVEVRELTLADTKAQMLALGGPEKVLGFIKTSDIDEIQVGFENRLRDSDFSAQDKAVLSRNTKVWLRSLYREWLKKDLNAELRIAPLADHDVTDLLSGFYQDNARYFSMQRQTESFKTLVKLKNGETKSIDLPVFQFSTEERIMGLKLLSQNPRRLGWAQPEREGIKAEWAQMMKDAGGDDIDWEHSSASARNWLATQKAVFQKGGFEDSNAAATP